MVKSQVTIAWLQHFRRGDCRMFNAAVQIKLIHWVLSSGLRGGGAWLQDQRENPCVMLRPSGSALGRDPRPDRCWAPLMRSVFGGYDHGQVPYLQTCSRENTAVPRAAVIEIWPWGSNEAYKQYMQYDSHRHAGSCSIATAGQVSCFRDQVPTALFIATSAPILVSLKLHIDRCVKPLSCGQWRGLISV